jgi:ABC-type phosphate/phosphonate transport system substrate-binding protein
MYRKLVAVVGAAALLIAACGGSDDSDAGDGGGDRQAVIDWMLGQGETQESAECFADELSGYTSADFEAFEAAASPEDAPEGMAEDVLAAAATCVGGAEE